MFRPVFFILCLLFVMEALQAETNQEVAVSDPTPNDTTTIQLSVGDTLDSFMLPRFPDRTYVALRDYVGEPRLEQMNQERKPVIISFFASWCIPCREEIPELEKLADKWGDEVQVFLISVGDRPQQLQNWIERYPTSLPILMDPYSVTSVDRYGIASIPTLVLLSEEAEIRYLAVGYEEGNIQDLEREVQKLVE